MFYRGCMRRGVSLEVIVEEDDGAQVSFGPSSPDEDFLPSSPTSSSERDEKSTTDCEREGPETPPEMKQSWRGRGGEEDEEKGQRKRLKEEKKKRKRKKAEWLRIMERRRRSVSCETLTVLDVGEDKASQDDWAEEAKEWHSSPDDSFDPYSSRTISRRKILLQTSLGEGGAAQQSSASELEEHSDGFYESVSSPQPSSAATERESSLSPDYNDPIYAELVQIVDDEGPPSDSDCSPFNRENEAGKPGADDHAPPCSSATERQSNFGANHPTNRPESKGMSETSQGATISPPKLPTEKYKEDRLAFDDSLDHYDFVDLRKEVAERWQRDPFSAANVAWPNENLHMYANNVEHDTHGHIPDKDEQLNELNDASGAICQRLETRAHENDLITAALTEIVDGDHEDNVNKENSLQNEVTVVETERTISSREDLDEESLHQAATNVYKNKELYPEELPKPHTVASVRQLFEGTPQAKKLQAFHRDLTYGLFDHVRSNPSSKILRFEREREEKSPIKAASEYHDQRRLASRENLSRQLRNEWGGANESGEGGEFPSDQRKKGEVGAGHLLLQRPARLAKPGGTLTLKLSKGRHDAVIHLRKPKVARNFNVERALRDNPRDFHVKISHKIAISHRKSDGHISDAPRASASKAKLPKSQNASEKFEDAESWTSESSEDSGVLRDFNSSSILSTFAKSKSSSSSGSQQIVFDQHLDHSFKWIDPGILAKIRSAGTTVIFFGPRYRRQQARGAIPPLVRASSPSFEKKENTDIFTRSAAPRIVGVVPKMKGCVSTDTTKKRKLLAQRDREVTWRSPSSTILYDFTRKTAQSTTEGYG